MIKLAIFDLDGVIVDTAKYHYLAWKDLGKKMGFDFTAEQNEAFKGVSRLVCMDIMCELSGKTAWCLKMCSLVSKLPLQLT